GRPGMELGGLTGKAGSEPGAQRPPPAGALGPPGHGRIAAGDGREVGTRKGAVEEPLDAEGGEPLDAGLDPAGRPLDALDVLLEIDDGPALHVPEDLVRSGVVAHEPLELGVELPDAGHQGVE